MLKLLSHFHQTKTYETRIRQNVIMTIIKLMCVLDDINLCIIHHHSTIGNLCGINNVRLKIANFQLLDDNH